MPPDFLNSREDAALIWTVVVVAFVICKNPGVLGSLLGVLWLAVKPPLLFLFGGAAVYCVGILVAANELEVWHTSALKETVYWFVGTGLVLAGHATGARPDPDYARTLLRRALSVTIVVEFIVNLHVFPLAVELAFVPLVAFFLMVDAWNQSQSQANPRLMKFADRGQATIGWLVLLSVLLRIGLHPGDLITRDTLERLLVVPALAIAFIPFLYLVAWYSRRQVDAVRRHFALN